jgi:hypothetical protein
MVAQWLLMVAHGCSWLLMVAQWLLMVAQWLLMVAHGCSMVAQTKNYPYKISKQNYRTVTSSHIHNHLFFPNSVTVSHSLYPLFF